MRDVPGILEQAVGPERVGAGAGDHGHVRQGLGVVHQRALAADAQGRALVRAEGREGLAGLDPAGQRRLLAGDEAVGWVHHRLGTRRAAGGHALVHRPRHGGGDMVAPLGHADGDPARAAGRGEELRAVEHEVGRADEEQLVLVAGRLALHGVDDHRAAGTGGVRDGELDGGREPGPTAARQARGLEHRHECLAPTPGAGPRQRHRAQCGHVAGQVGGVAEQPVAPGGGDGLAHVRHGGIPPSGARSARGASAARPGRSRGPSAPWPGGRPRGAARPAPRRRRRRTRRRAR